MSNHPLHIPWREHLFSKHAYPEYAWLIFHEVAVPWWWPTQSPRACAYHSLLYDELVLVRRPGCAPLLAVLLDSMGYILFFPVRIIRKAF